MRLPLLAHLSRAASRLSAAGTGFRQQLFTTQAGAGGARHSLLRTFSRVSSYKASALLGATWGLGVFARPAAAAAAFSTSTATAASIIDQLTFKEMGMLSWLIVDVAIQWAGWAVSAALKTEKFYDMLGTGSFAVLAIGSLLKAPSMHARKIAATAFVVAWAVRLGGFLVVRVWKTGHDSRFDEAKHQPFKFWIYWTMQAVWVFTTLLPVLLLNTSTAGGPAAVLWTDIVGGAMYATGLAIEAVADGQKFAFKLDPSNRGKFIDTGLWTYARYPNYFGEMMIWWGMFTFCTGGLRGAQLASVASPLFVMLLLRFVSGVPLQEKQAQARWGTTQEYMDYRARTNLLVPVPKCWTSKAQTS